MRGVEIELDALDDLILGRGVRRGRHRIPEGLFGPLERRLSALGFAPVLVVDLEVPPGTRIPAWHLAPPLADFGNVFWEVFTDRFRRKLFGSEVRNAKGDWDVLLTASSKRPIWANPLLAERYDDSRPVGMY